MTWGLALTFLGFVSILGFSLRDPAARARLQARQGREWIVDALCLLHQGLVIPLLQTFVLVHLLIYLAPTFRGVLSVPAWLAFLLSFVFMDYLYYWNHRLLHSRTLWPWHRMHHSARQMEFLITSRNSLMTPFLIVYVWGNAFFVYLLGDATWFLLASSVGAAMDLWRHSGFVVPVKSPVYTLLSPWLTLPQDHSWHHSEEQGGCNFGANLIVWDKWHGTLFRSAQTPERWASQDAAVTWKEFLR